jgi:hypothetical protein
MLWPESTFDLDNDLKNPMGAPSHQQRFSAILLNLAVMQITSVYYASLLP